ncbi:DinB family protein [Salinimicrobium sp. GXAS 041]|uniref:DinB family protein n=1 Tax=Salinimicrobium sp. GXAS 041 TaxID=3400806 RepID=UPI003C7615E4
MQEAANIKKQLVKHLNGGEAFMALEETLKKIEYKKLGERPQDLPYSFYELFYHIWFTQNDILNYCTKREYHAPEWPTDYWPVKRTSENEEEWENLKKHYLQDRQRLIDLILSSENALFAPVPSNPQHTIFREMMLAIEHTAYHTGQLLIVLRHLELHQA